MSTKNKKPIATSVLDDLIKDIESAWGIAMEKTLKKNDDQDDDDSDAPEAPVKEGPPADSGAPADGQEGVAPAGQDQMGGAPGSDGQDPAAGGAPGADGQNPDQQLEQEGQQDQDGEISDEELQQIYGSMDPQELERHYMILRGILRDQYQKAEAGTEDKKDEDKSAKDMDKCGDMTMSKSEKMVQDENKALRAKVEQLEKSTEGLLKAVKILTQPTRKAATTEIEFIKKSEESANEMTLSKTEIKEKLSQICKTNMTLTKHERDLVNRYILNGSNELEVLKLIGAKS